MHLTVQAGDLRPGDLCLGSGTKILSAPSRGLYTPAGKVDLNVKRRNGVIHGVTWNIRTRIKIERTDA